MSTLKEFFKEDLEFFSKSYSVGDFLIATGMGICCLMIGALALIAEASRVL